MTYRLAACLVPVFLLAACASLDGTYSPDCIAYEGDSVEIRDGRFTWDRFTDAIPVDDAGNPVDATPGYPIQGSFDRSGNALTFTADSGDLLELLYPRQHDGRQYLLNDEQRERFDSAGEMSDCALVLGGHDANP